MPVLSPTSSQTWTDERIELLKQHFEAGLSCREIAADIGVSRNAVIGKLSPPESDARPDHRRPQGTEQGHRAGARAADRAAAAIRDARHDLWRHRRARSHRPDRRCQSLLAAGACREPLPLADLHAWRRRFLLLRQLRIRRPVLLRRPQPPRLPAKLPGARDAQLSRAQKRKTSGRALPEVSGGLASRQEPQLS
ncbi:hypothetical protein ACVWWR_007732 [Bradyrhizobium sp. LM3.2]